MALNYEEVSKKIIEAVGGEKNIASATHCMTRLRLVLNDESKAQDDKVQSIKGVKSVIRQGGQYQIVIGNEVSNLFKTFEKMGNFGENEGGAVKPTGNILQRMFGFVAGCMTPMLPAMLGTGMVKVLLTLLTTMGVMSASAPTYIIFFSMADCFFYFLPIFIAVQIAKKTRHSIPLFMVIGAMMCYPNLITLLGGGTEGITMGTFLGMSCTYLFGFIPVISTTYTSSLLPIMLMTPVMCWTEDFADRVSPNLVKAFLKPMLFCLICTPIALCVLGPLGGVIGNVLSVGVSALYNAAPWLTVGVLSAAMPFIVMTGMHYALIPLTTNNLAVLGYDVILMVTMFCSNIAQGGASFGVAMKTKNEETKSEGIACGISAIVAGITEPAMYGINLRFMKPMIAAVVGAGISGLVLGITGVKGYTMGGSPSLLTIVTFIGGDKPMNGLIFGAVGAVISVVVPFILSYIMYKDPEGEVTVSAVTSEASSASDANANTSDATEEAADAKAAEALVERIELSAPMTGKIVPLSEVPDEVFSSGCLGEGVAVIPEDGNVYAPCDAKVTTTMDTKHAVGLTTKSGVELLIHVGLDTVSLEGKPFQYYVKEGDEVKKGQLLLSADLKAIEASGLKTHTPVIITNADDYVSIKSVEADNVKNGDKLITVI